MDASFACTNEMEQLGSKVIETVRGTLDKCQPSHARTSNGVHFKYFVALQDDTTNA